METRTCKDCGRELPISKFKKTAFGTRVFVCNECASKKARANKLAKSLAVQGVDTIVHDDAFDSKEPREVIDMMSRAKRWLESRGYTITLKGEYREVKIREVKF